MGALMLLPVMDSFARESRMVGESEGGSMSGAVVVRGSMDRRTRWRRDIVAEREGVD